jgi:hypothetical protein
MLWSWWSTRTVSKKRSGFQMPGVFARCATRLHAIALSSAQSGCDPLRT